MTFSFLESSEKNLSPILHKNGSLFFRKRQKSRRYRQLLKKKTPAAGKTADA
ncbi:hypothetical protein BAXH7_01417 [Bacillus amyloliquefaciens XH7]|jgi:hypothetical protein|nr:hypothetical protein LL3_02210 [Bacillus amyloliquefaciens LL3]AEK88555.1 hypothetical protein BAXH7_01417 [Bacillus amyloliquefaciens XH7]KYC95858.1 hypothetical protein B425_2713 [Bacillus amyloliquefaciens]